MGEALDPCVTPCPTSWLYPLLLHLCCPLLASCCLISVTPWIVRKIGWNNLHNSFWQDWLSLVQNLHFGDEVFLGKAPRLSLVVMSFLSLCFQNTFSKHLFSAKTRQGALESLRLAFSSKILFDFLLERRLTLTDSLEKCLKKGTCPHFRWFFPLIFVSHCFYCPFYNLIVFCVLEPNLYSASCSFTAVIVTITASMVISIFQCRKRLMVAWSTRWNRNRNKNLKIYVAGETAAVGCVYFWESSA